MRQELYITVNSPGEMAGWATPVIREMLLRLRSLQITLVIPPCQYASGSEKRYGEKIAGVARSVTFWQALREGRLCDEARIAVLHLGGDFAYSVALSRRLKAPLFAYAARPRWARFVEHFFVPNTAAERNFAAHGIKPNRYTCVGHLALDSVVLAETEEETRDRLGIDSKQPLLAFLTGSRPLEYREGMPFFIDVAARLLDVYPQYQAVFPMAPTVDSALFMRFLNEKKIVWSGKSRVREVSLGKDRWARVLWDFPLEAVNCCTLAVTVPGTNNLQLAALYTPFVMVLPLQKAEEFPLDGIGGVLPLKFPGVKWLKRRIIFGMNRRIPFASLPNKLAGRMIAPEVRGLIGPKEVSEKALELLGSEEKREQIARSFWELTHQRGASVKIASAIADVLNS